jgi:tetratricopeptide (TPR) repeat protein
LVWIAAASLGTTAMAATAATSPAAAVKPVSEPVSELLEKAIYKEESAGDLDAAIQIYQQIIQQAEANRHAVAEAHYRLGMCLIKKGEKEKGGEILTKLVEGYPEEKDLVKKAHEQLQPALNLIPAPWKNGEAFTLSILAPSGSEIGTLSYTARLTEVKGIPAWEISGEHSVSPSQFTQSTRVVAERDTFAPITGYTKSSLMGEFDAQYSKGLVRLKIKGKQGEQTKEIPLDQVAYDNEQVLFLIRRLPLAENYKTAFPIFTVQGATVVECGIEVTGKEKVKVPVGEYECFAVKLQVRLQGTVALEHRLWFSNDANRYVVKYDAGSAMMELTQLGAAKGADKGGDKKLAETHAQKGWQLWRERKLAEAEKEFLEAVAADPQNTNAWNGLGWARLNQGMRENAKEAFGKCVALDPKHPAALNGLGWIAKGEGKVDEAIQWWEKAVAAVPGTTAALNGLAETYMERKEYAKAAEAYEKWLQFEPENKGAKEGLEKAKGLR